MVHLDANSSKHKVYMPRQLKISIMYFAVMYYITELEGTFSALEYDHKSK